MRGRCEAVRMVRIDDGASHGAIVRFLRENGARIYGLRRSAISSPLTPIRPAILSSETYFRKRRCF